MNAMDGHGKTTRCRANLPTVRYGDAFTFPFHPKSDGPSAYILLLYEWKVWVEVT